MALTIVTGSDNAGYGHKSALKELLAGALPLMEHTPSSLASSSPSSLLCVVWRAPSSFGRYGLAQDALWRTVGPDVYTISGVHWVGLFRFFISVPL